MKFLVPQELMSEVNQRGHLNLYAALAGACADREAGKADALIRQVLLDAGWSANLIQWMFQTIELRKDEILSQTDPNPKFILSPDFFEEDRLSLIIITLLGWFFVLWSVADFQYYPLIGIPMLWTAETFKVIFCMIMGLIGVAIISARRGHFHWAWLTFGVLLLGPLGSAVVLTLIPSNVKVKPNTLDPEFTELVEMTLPVPTKGGPLQARKVLLAFDTRRPGSQPQVVYVDPEVIDLEPKDEAETRS
ncbi:MAG: hypothetical protein BGO01_09120 [Armatimonadetes bacterium 55-13]|nr:hypothetical protein [Armatimonadota bacterium]OJU62173.1 MAG: hypothetical protein BGO01_09120 [Armatimonadetes bacterium 55-13]